MADNLKELWKAPEFPVTILPPADALHSHDLFRDSPLQNVDLTVRPKRLGARFCHGAGLPNWNCIGKSSLVWMWPQELWVFYLEMTPYLRAQLLLDAIEAQAKADREKYGVDGAAVIAVDSKRRSDSVTAARCKKKAKQDEETISRAT